MPLQKQVRRARRGSRIAGLALVLGLAAGFVVQAVPASAATAATSASAGSAASGGSTILANLRESLTIPAGKGPYATTIHGVSFTVAKSTTANYCNIESQTLLSGSTVMGVASISCADEVYAAAVGAALYFGTTEESYKVTSEYSTFFVQVTTTAPLQAGTWQTEALADVYWTGPSAYTQYGPSYSSAYWNY